jgi:hypothetical protein
MPTQRYGAIPGSPEAGHLAALKTLWQLAYLPAQAAYASTLAYADAFRAIMLAFIVATLLVPLRCALQESPVRHASRVIGVQNHGVLLGQGQYDSLSGAF